MDKVIMFSSVHQWNDTRIFLKEATSLAKNYIVELHAAANFKYKEINDVKIYGLPLWKKRSDRKRVNVILLKRLLRLKADIYHFHDPELIYHGLIVKFILGKKVIYDIHENYNETLKTKYWLPKIIRISLSFLYRITEIISQYCFDQLVLAEESYTEFIHRNYTIIRNYPILHSFHINREKKYDLVYIGGITKIRGIFELIKATSLIRNSIKSFKLLIIGPIEPGLETELKFLIRKNNLENNIIFKGRMSFDKAVFEIRKSKVGVSIIHPVKNYIKSISTKIYEYMESGIPSIYSNFSRWCQEFDELHIGVAVDPLNIEDIAQKAISLLNNTTTMNCMGRMGRNYVEKKYNWSSEENKLLLLYRNILR